MPEGPAWYPPARSFSSGRWALVERDGELAEIRIDGQVVLRGIRAIVRKSDWTTVPWMVEEVAVEDAAITVHLRAANPQARGTLRAEVDGDELTAAVELEAAEELETNRAGLIVLHPPQLAGTPLTVRHPDGGQSPAEFPSAPAPHQPARDIAGLSWQVSGLRVDLDLDGDVFEMEDQRNWTDASFKTYNRPLALPFPYRIAAGERIRQSLRLRVSGRSAGAAAKKDAFAEAPATMVLTAAGPVPKVSLGASTAPDPAPHLTDGPGTGAALLVELDLRTPTWRAALERAAREGHSLDVRFVLDPESPGQVRAAVGALDGLPVLRVAAFSAGPPARHVSDAATVAELRLALAETGLDLPVIGGARSHFTEFNRQQHHVPGDLDGLAVAMTPLFHDLGTPQLVEAVAVQRTLARRLVELARGREVHVGPVTLRPRFNDVAADQQPLPTRTDLTEGYGAALTGSNDPRQHAPELAAWTIASFAALAVPGVASVSYFEQWGPRGVVGSDGAPYPVAAAIEALLGLAAPGEPPATHGNRSADAAPSGALPPHGDVHLLSGDSPDGLLWAVGSTNGARTTLLLANLHPVAHEVRVNTRSGTVTERIDADSWVRRTLA